MRLLLTVFVMSITSGYALCQWDIRHKQLHFDIPQESLADAIQDWQFQAGTQPFQQVLYMRDDVLSRTQPVQALICDCKPAAALMILLRNTGLDAQPVKDGVWVIQPIGRCKPSLGAQAPVPPCTQPQKDKTI